MIPDFDVSLRLEVIESLRLLPKTERQRIFRWIDQLRFAPLPTGDFVESDDTGRTLQVAVVNRHAISYWLDGPVNEIKIVAIASADGDKIRY